MDKELTPGERARGDMKRESIVLQGSQRSVLEQFLFNAVIFLGTSRGMLVIKVFPDTSKITCSKEKDVGISERKGLK